MRFLSITNKCVIAIGITVMLTAISFVTNASSYEFSTRLSLASLGFNHSHWLSPIPHPSKNNHLFISHKNGKIFDTKGGKISPSPLLDLAATLDKTTLIALTSFTLHPSFSDIDSRYFGTVYTAHIEPYNRLSRTRRIENNKQETPLEFDAVITQWTMSHSNKLTIDPLLKREILRINIADPQTGIENLTFNPTLLPWMSNFGLLHFSLNQQMLVKSNSLYSGAILRIHPDKFGLQAYTVPSDNPFSQNDTVNSEIVKYDLGVIDSISHLKNLNSQLVVQYQQKNQRTISLQSITSSNIQANEKVLWTSKNTTKASVISFAVSDKKSVNDKLMLLHFNQQQWQLTALAYAENDTTADELEQLPQRLSNTAEQLILSDGKAGNMLIFKAGSGEIVNLTKAQPQLIENTTEDIIQPERQTALAPSEFTNILVIIVVIIVLFFLIKKIASQSPKQELRKQYARFTYDADKTLLSFYRRHDKDIDTTLPLEQIKSSEIFLNEQSLHVLSAQESAMSNTMNNATDTKIRAAFAQEKREKMMHDKVRKVTLSLITKDKEQIQICLYLRQGNQRLTKEKYQQVLEQLIDWQWQYSQAIYPNVKHERVVQLQESFEQDKFTSSNHPTQQPPKTMSEAKREKFTSSTRENITTLDDNDPNDEAVEPQQDITQALNKLITMRQQEFLTEEEFTLAKKKLLN